MRSKDRRLLGSPARRPLALLLLGISLPLWAGPERRPVPAPLSLPLPLRRHAPRVAPGERVPARHFSSPYPARAALAIAGETWVATPAGVLRFDGRLARDPLRARPIGLIDVGSGLPSQSVRALCPSAAHVLVATDAGLVRVDRAGRVRGPVLLPGRRVTSLAGDAVGTFGGVFLLDDGLACDDTPPGVRRRSARRARCAGEPAAPLPAPRLLPETRALSITDLLRCGDDLFLATHAEGLLRLHGGRLAPVPGLSDGHVARLAGCARGGPVWAATAAGLYRVDARGEGSRRVWRGHATTAAIDSDGGVLFGTFGQGAFLHASTLTRIVPSGEQVSLLHAVAPGRVLVGTEIALGVRDAAGRRAALPLSGPPPGPVTALLPDGEGGVWAGSFEHGLGHLGVDDAWRRAPLADGRVTALALAPGQRVLVGTASGLLVQDRERRERFVPLRDPRGWLRRHVSSLRVEGRHVLVAVWPGLVVLESLDSPDPAWRYLGAAGAEADAGLVGPTVYGVAMSGGGLWVGTDDGLSLLPDPLRSPATSSGPRFPGLSDAGPHLLSDLGGVLPDNWINDLRAAGPRVWVLTLRSGLLRLDPRGTTVFDTRLMTSPSVLLVLHERALFGTNSFGLAVLDGPRGIRTFGPAQGLASEMVTALAHEPRRDRLWVGGSGGVSRIDGASRALGLVDDESSDRVSRAMRLEEEERP